MKKILITFFILSGFVVNAYGSSDGFSIKMNGKFKLIQSSYDIKPNTRYLDCPSIILIQSEVNRLSIQRILGNESYDVESFAWGQGCQVKGPYKTCVNTASDGLSIKASGPGFLATMYTSRTFKFSDDGNELDYSEKISYGFSLIRLIPSARADLRADSSHCTYQRSN